MTILVVDDELLIRNVVKEYCENELYKVIEAENGIEALEKLDNNEIDLVILDIMMPKLDGFTTCQKIKSIKNIPIIMLSARQEEYDKLLGFDKGIDDYVTKPFSPKELIARIKAVIKRSQTVVAETYTFDKLVIDSKAHTVAVDSKEISLTPKEYDLLLYFAENVNIALSREQLLNKVWGYDFFGDDRTIDTHIKMLRNHLGKYRKLIVTVRGMGYKLEYKKK